MRIRIRMATFLISVLLVLPASAEFYKYVDENGIMCFSDDTGKVPDSALPDLEAFYEIPLESCGATRGSQWTDSFSTIGEAEDIKADLRIQAEAMESEQVSLEEEYESLQSEKRELGEPPQPSSSRTEKRIYKSRVEALNRKISDYEERRKQFESKVDNFNARIDRSGVQ